MNKNNLIRRKWRMGSAQETPVDPFVFTKVMQYLPDETTVQNIKIAIEKEVDIYRELIIILNEGKPIEDADTKFESSSYNSLSAKIKQGEITQIHYEINGTSISKDLFFCLDNKIINLMTIVNENYQIPLKHQKVYYNENIIKKESTFREIGLSQAGKIIINLEHFIIQMRMPDTTLKSFSVNCMQTTADLEKQIETSKPEYKDKRIKIEGITQGLTFVQQNLDTAKTYSVHVTDAKPIVVFVRSLSGASYEINTDQNETILNLKGIVQQKNGMPISKQKIIYKEMQQEDTKTLIECGIEDKANLFVVAGIPD